MSRTLSMWLLIAAVPLVAGGCASAPASSSASRVEPQTGALTANHAVKLVGTPYRYGGASPARGFDCSGLVQFSFRRAGIAVPRSTEAQLRASRRVPRSQLRPGDLVFFDQDGKKKGHVGIYLGNGRFVHAPSSGKRVRTDSLDSRYWKRHLSDTRRL
jgi:cell wall-associated NlpC family hydrolase